MSRWETRGAYLCASSHERDVGLLIPRMGGEQTRGAYMCAGSHELGMGILIRRVGGEPLGDAWCLPVCQQS